MEMRDDCDDPFTCPKSISYFSAWSGYSAHFVDEQGTMGTAQRCGPGMAIESLMIVPWTFNEQVDHHRSQHVQCCHGDVTLW